MTFDSFIMHEQDLNPGKVWLLETDHRLTGTIMSGDYNINYLN